MKIKSNIYPFKYIWGPGADGDSIVFMRDRFKKDFRGDIKTQRVKEEPSLRDGGVGEMIVPVAEAHRL